MTSSKSERIKARLSEFCGLMVLRYRGLEFDIDPFNPALFHVSCGGYEWDAHSIEEVMDTPFMNGKRLRDIAEEVEIVDW